MDNNNAAFIWNIADSLRGVFRATEYGRVILPFAILRRMDCLLEPTKQAVVDYWRESANQPEAIRIIRARNIARGGMDEQKDGFYNVAPFTLTTLLDQPADLRANLYEYINGFSENVRDIFEAFELSNHIEKLAANELLFLIVQKFANIDLHPNVLSNHEMGLMFEELIRRFAEDQASDNGEFFTPRDAIQLVAELVIDPDRERLRAKEGYDSAPILRIYDPTAGTGGMLSVGAELIEAVNKNAVVELYGQELEASSYAICKADMLAKGQSTTNIKLGNTLTYDQHQGQTFDYILSNPPYGANWEREKAAVLREHQEQGFEGRFGPGVPATSDGQLLFLLHVISKLTPKEHGGGRAGVVMNGSSLFTGDAGSGASNIRRWLFENDLVDAIVALPENMFYSTGIATYIWIIDNDKPVERKGNVQLINGVNVFSKMRKNLGGKSRILEPLEIARYLESYNLNLDASKQPKFFVEKTQSFWSSSIDLSQDVMKATDQKDSTNHVSTLEIEVEVADGDKLHIPGGGFALNIGLENEGQNLIKKLNAVKISRIFPISYFGYQVITIERPLRRRYSWDYRKNELETLVLKSDIERQLDIWGNAHLTGLYFDTQHEALAKIQIIAEKNGKKLLMSERTKLVNWMQSSENNENVPISRDTKGNILPDPTLRDTEIIALDENQEIYLKQELTTRDSNAWIDKSKTKIGYEISFNKIFYRPQQMRRMWEIDLDLRIKIQDLEKTLKELM